ncbi:MAG: site-specific DNA-methyltransferase [Lentisphaeria bacterium]|nr:site-specific DNA-methyltransferase [Lentisphaeria bacterium]
MTHTSSASSRNKTLQILPEERGELLSRLSSFPGRKMEADEIKGKLFHGDLFSSLEYFPAECVDLLILDPPYNLAKSFGNISFKKCSMENYILYLKSFLHPLKRLLKKNASLYLCGDWNSCGAIQKALEEESFIIRNRITWQREKGRGAKSNWKNCSEDIWFATNSEDYYFNADAVKMRKKVIAPYREEGKPRDWKETAEGRFRLTAPSNFLNDITVPYWSMPENTLHPTQKPEKLMAKLILASSREGDMVFDPFSGSGSTLVTARKLNREFCGIEQNEEYCLYAVKRLLAALENKRIQGYDGKAFLERNTVIPAKGHFS